MTYQKRKHLNNTGWILPTWMSRVRQGIAHALNLHKMIPFPPAPTLDVCLRDLLCFILFFNHQVLGSYDYERSGHKKTLDVPMKEEPTATSLITLERQKGEHCVRTSMMIPRR